MSKQRIVAIAAAASLLVFPSAAIALTIKYATVRDTGARIRFDFRVCDPGFVGQGYTVRYQLANLAGRLVLSHPWHYQRRYACEGNFFSVKDVYEPGRYVGRITVTTRDGVKRTSLWRPLTVH